MKKIRIRVMSLFMSLLMIFPALANTAFASENNNTDVSQEEYLQIKNDIESQLKLYFDEIGEINQDGNYVVKNPELLKERAESGDEDAKNLYELYILKQNRSVKDGLYCVFDDQYGWIVDLFNGRTLEAIGGYIKDKAWDKAAEIIAPVVAKALKTTTKNVNFAITGVSLAISIYNCRGEF